MDINKMIDELYRVVGEYQKEKSDQFNYRLEGLYSQIEVLEALKDGSSEEYIKKWHKCLIEDKPGKKRD